MKQGERMVQSDLREIVVFEIGDQRFGIPLTDTRELLRVPTTSPLPGAPSIIEGVVNIRDKIVPVLDIRKRFRLPAKAVQPSDYLVIAHVDGRTVALRVDMLHGHIRINAKDIENVETISTHAEYVAGVAKLPDGLVLIHDLRTFLTESEVQEMDNALDNSSMEHS